MMIVQSQGGIDMKPTANDIEDFVRDLFHWLYIDGREISSWMTKYPYFKLRSEFEKELEKLRYGPRLAEHRLLKAILGDQIHNHDVLPVQYNYRSVYQRLLELLRQMDKEVPGTFHEGAAM